MRADGVKETMSEQADISNQYESGIPDFYWWTSCSHNVSSRIVKQCLMKGSVFVGSEWFNGNKLS